MAEEEAYQLKMIAGRVPWKSRLTRANGTNVERLVNFDLNLVPLAQRTNVLLASLDAAGQIFAARRTQEIMIPVDHYENDEGNNVEEEVDAVKKHLTELTIRVTVENFNKTSEQASLGISQSFESEPILHTLRFNGYIFSKDLIDGNFVRNVVAGGPTSTHEAMHSKGRIDNVKARTPDKLKSAGAMKNEAGFYVEELLFGGEILPRFGKGGDTQAPATTVTMGDPQLFDRPLRFAPVNATRTPRSYYQVDDVWAFAFVRDIAEGALAARIDATQAGSIPLLPNTVNSGAFKPPTVQEIRSLCHRPDPGADLAAAEAKGKKKTKKKE
jgi:hypothetical protein